jgi:hypothetical protein
MAGEVIGSCLPRHRGKKFVRVVALRAKQQFAVVQGLSLQTSNVTNAF